MAFIRNAWYPVAEAGDVAAGPIARKLVGEELVIYRGESGALVAMGDRCPHRFAPLHLGTVVGDSIDCPYHGLRFSDSGRCVFNPVESGKVPGATRTRVYPATERWNYIWVWPGDAAEADPAAIPALDLLLDTPTNRVVSGRMELPVNYLHGIDNAMDAAHVPVLHRAGLASGIVEASMTAWEEPNGEIWIDRVGEDTPPPPLYARFWELAHGHWPERVDHWTASRWQAPCVVVNFTGIGRPGADRKDGMAVLVIHMFVPQDETNTLYLWALARSVVPDSAEMDVAFAEGFERVVVNEDLPMMEMVEKSIGGRDLERSGAALMGFDKALILVRRAIRARIGREEALSAAA